MKIKAESEVSRFKDTAKYYLDGEIATRPEGVWLWHDALKMQEKMIERGLLRQTICGNSTIICFNVKDYVDYQYNEMLENPEKWLEPKGIEWINKYKKS